MFLDMSGYFGDVSSISDSSLPPTVPLIAVADFARILGPLPGFVDRTVAGRFVWESGAGRVFQSPLCSDGSVGSPLFSLRVDEQALIFSKLYHDDSMLLDDVGYVRIRDRICTPPWLDEPPTHMGYET